jgi:hypothetical protein
MASATESRDPGTGGNGTADVAHALRCPARIWKTNDRGREGPPCPQNDSATALEHRVRDLHDATARKIAGAGYQHPTRLRGQSRWENHARTLTTRTRGCVLDSTAYVSTPALLNSGVAG